MITATYADFAWEKTAQLLAIDSPSGFTDRAAKWVCAEFQQMGFNASLTTKGGVLVDLGGSDTRDGLLLEAHADTLGGMVSQIKATGCLKITNLGGMNANNAEAENVRVYTRDGRVYEGTAQLHDPSIHVNGGYNDAKRSWDNVEIVLDEDVKTAADIFHPRNIRRYIRAVSSDDGIRKLLSGELKSLMAAAKKAREQFDQTK